MVWSSSDREEPRGPKKTARRRGEEEFFWKLKLAVQLPSPGFPGYTYLYI